MAVIEPQRGFVARIDRQCKPPRADRRRGRQRVFHQHVPQPEPARGRRQSDIHDLQRVAPRRAVQQHHANGLVTFKSIFPGAYSGRYPHVHFQVFSKQADISSYRNAVTVSQLALPEDVCTTVYTASAYATSKANFPQTPVTRDNVFSDGVTQQMAKVTGSNANGYIAQLTIAV